MLKTERLEKILAKIQEQHTISVGDLSACFDVSEITIRRDLDDLYDMGKIMRVRGGAQRLGPNSPEPPVIHRQIEQVVEKEAIARKALEFISDGETIALESGSTTLALARALAAQKWQILQVVTNSITILNALVRVPGICVTFIGGFVDPNELCTYGALTEEALRHLHVQKLFCGCRGLDPKFGRSNEIQTGIEIGTVRAFVASSCQVFVLADHTKFGKVFSLQLLTTSEINTLITTEIAPQNSLEEIQKQGVKIVKAPLPRSEPEEHPVN